MSHHFANNDFLLSDDLWNIWVSKTPKYTLKGRPISTFGAVSKHDKNRRRKNARGVAYCETIWEWHGGMEARSRTNIFRGYNTQDTSQHVQLGLRGRLWHHPLQCGRRRERNGEHRPQSPPLLASLAARRDSAFSNSFCHCWKVFSPASYQITPRPKLEHQSIVFIILFIPIFCLPLLCCRRLLFQRFYYFFLAFFWKYSFLLFLNLSIFFVDLLVSATITIVGAFFWHVSKISIFSFISKSMLTFFRLWFLAKQAMPALFYICSLFCFAKRDQKTAPIVAWPQYTVVAAENSCCPCRAVWLADLNPPFWSIFF